MTHGTGFLAKYSSFEIVIAGLDPRGWTPVDVDQAQIPESHAHTEPLEMVVAGRELKSGRNGWFRFTNPSSPAVETRPFRPPGPEEGADRNRVKAAFRLPNCAQE
jgi:hypothetical protein